MIILSLTGHERLQFQYILPVQGSIETLELVKTIFEKVNIDVKNTENAEDVNFEANEIDFLVRMINILDQQAKLHFQSLSLVKKILK